MPEQAAMLHPAARCMRKSVGWHLAREAPVRELLHAESSPVEAELRLPCVPAFVARRAEKLPWSTPLVVAAPPPALPLRAVPRPQSGFAHEPSPPLPERCAARTALEIRFSAQRAQFPEAC